jgi:hypothetical protein
MTPRLADSERLQDTGIATSRALSGSASTVSRENRGVRRPLLPSMVRKELVDVASATLGVVGQT